MELTAQMLIEQTHNFYGLKAELSKAKEYLANFVGATPGGFYDWVHQQNSSVW